MKRVLISIATLLIAALTTEAQITFGEKTLLNDGWSFRLDSINDYSALKVTTKGWRSLDLPHDWSIEGVASADNASCTGYLPGGVGWYRKDVTIPKTDADKKFFLYFEGVYNNSRVWVNGKEVGYRPNGYVSFVYDITPYVRYGRTNVIAVSVDHRKSADSRYYTGSGIYRNVYLVCSEKVHMDNWGVLVTFDSVSKQKAVAKVETTIVNESNSAVTATVHNELFRKGAETPIASVADTITIEACSSAVCNQSAEIANPVLWDIDSPELYTMVTTILDQEGIRIDGTSTVTGIRDIRFDANKGFSLNGRNIKMKGVCLHHDAGSLGAVVPEQVWKRRLATLKEIGCNAIRMSHNPQAEVVYDLCDRMGFLVMDEAFDEWEFPKRKWIEGWNKGKNPGYQGYSEYFNDWAERDLADMVRRDRNHPSIVLWSIGNEVDYPNDPYSHPILDHEGINQKTIPGYKPEKPNAERIGHIAKRLVKVVKAIDISRPVTGAMAGVVMSNQTDYPATLDVTGYNYTENRYLKDHIAYPERIIYGSENQHSYQQWLAVKDNEFVFGQFLWTGIDYLGEAGPYPSRGFVCGLMDLGGFIKSRGYYRQSLWSDKPMVYICTKRIANIGKKANYYDFESAWNYSEGDTVRVAAFTNCRESALFLNDKKISAEPKWNENSNSFYWDIPFEAGELKVVGYNNGQEVAEYTIRTYGKAALLTAGADKTGFDGKDDIVHVILNITDINGTRVLGAHPTVRCEVSGNGTLLGLENANPSYMESQQGDAVPAHKGRLLAYIKATDNSGDINVTFSVAELDKSITLTIPIE